MPASPRLQARLLDLGLLLQRLMLMAVGVYHGGQKVLGLFDETPGVALGAGLGGIIGMLESKGAPMSTAAAWAAGLAEFVGGILIGVGLLTRVAAFFFAFTMYVGAFMVHWPNFGLPHKGMEYALTLAIMLTALVLIGPGRLSLDALLFGGRRVAPPAPRA
ncbi:MAG TPA: DoxX family protein [Phycisphaerales bacterium]|nr:DoxX family protein [Phycisphaerales bacterium]